MKARLLAVLLVSTLVLTSAAHVALAQAIAGNNRAIAGDNQATAGENNTERQHVNCSQVQIALGGQYAAQGQYAGADGDATAEIAEDLNITQSQVNDCLGGQPNEGDDNARDDETDDRADESETTVASAGRDDVLAGTDPGGTLPDTGGPSLLAAAAGFALVLGGASLIRTGRGR